MFATLKEITGGTRGLGAALGLTGDNLAAFEAATQSVAAQIAAGKGQVIGWELTQKDFNTQMDKAKFATYKPGQKCENCRFFQGTAGQQYGPCQIFVGKSVNANGWCASYSAKV